MRWLPFVGKLLIIVNNTDTSTTLNLSRSATRILKNLFFLNVDLEKVFNHWVIGLTEADLGLLQHPRWSAL